MREAGPQGKFDGHPFYSIDYSVDLGLGIASVRFSATYTIKKIYNLSTLYNLFILFTKNSVA